MQAITTLGEGGLKNYVPLIYGSAAVGYKPETTENPSNSTHRWTFYIRPAEPGKNLNLIISKVIFRLHPTCTLPVVECLQTPFETSQLGWGEVCCLMLIVMHSIGINIFVDVFFLIFKTHTHTVSL